ncbi:MAG: hypothetical protein JOZ52_04945 [Acidobacteria bacterium]|nr:hypothetical protein [Acidobacteriota bacterium]
MPDLLTREVSNALEPIVLLLMTLLSFVLEETPRKYIPQRTFVTELLSNVLLSLSAPSNEVEGVPLPPEKIPKVSIAELLVSAAPIILVFFTTLLVAPVPAPRLERQTTAFAAVLLPLVKVRSRVVPPTVFEPSIVTKSAPLRLNTHVAAALPVMVGLTPDAGLIVIVFVALAPGLALMTSGNVSPAE